MESESEYICFSDAQRQTEIMESAGVFPYIVTCSGEVKNVLFFCIEFDLRFEFITASIEI